jgi:PAS domain S-box-containing protein
MPLGKISYALKKENPVSLHSLAKDTGEFGDIARLIYRFFKQKEELVQEVSERKKVEEVLHKSERKFRAIFDQTFQFVGLMKTDGTLIEANKSSLALSGIEESEVMGKLFWECPWWTHSKEMQDKLRNAVNIAAKGGFVRFEATHLAKDGSIHYVDFSLKPIKDESGSILFLIPEGRDITDRKNAEEQQKILLRDLMESKEILEYQKKILEDVNKELDDFTYIVSHDLKEPLRSIDAYSKFIVDDYKDKLGEEGKHYLERVRANTERMKKLIEDLLEISRLKKRGSTIEEIAAEELIDEVKMRLEYAIKQKNVEITIKDKLPKIFCDRVKLTEVFLNLISNAIKFNNKPKPIIEVGYSDKGTLHEFYVKDNGIGIKEEYFDKIFEIFQRLGKREDVEGTGAGLTIVKKIIQLHKGEIWLESLPEGGSTFYFTVPKDKSVILGKKLIGEILVEKKLVTEADIKKALEIQEDAGRTEKGGENA